ncbi:MAG: CotH kinase family protein [Fibrobacter sp.]|nr:CotH kinase family protein [Fibrobacter sp.]
MAWLAVFAVALLCSCSEDGSSARAVDDVLPQDTVNVDTLQNVGQNADSLAETEKIKYVGNSPVVMTEVDPVNAFYDDHEGDDAGWVELMNVTDSVVNLSGISLTDSKDAPHKWTFGNVEMAPKSFLLVFLSGKNLVDYEPPHDSTNMIGKGCWVWTDADNDPPGNSYAEPLEGHGGICFKQQGVRKVGVQMQLGDNQELGWSSISAFVGTNDGSSDTPQNLGTANELLLMGYITKDRVISLRLAQPDVDDWKGYEITLVGTGDSSTTYTVPLPQGTTFPDLSKIYGTRISPESKETLEVTVKFDSYVVRNRGHEPHTNFKSNKKGGSLYLVNDEDQMLDSIQYPELPVGKSWTFGVSSLGVPVWGYGDPSPYGNATGIVENTLSDPPASELPPSGFYQTPFTVTFDESRFVRCALGGFAPTEQTPAATAIRIEQTTTIRCASYVLGTTPSAVETRTYVFEEKPSIATVFITVDPLSMFDPDSGLYMEGNHAQQTEPHYGANYWADRELPVFVELMEMDGAFGFSESAGLQIFGNYSRTNEKKSVAIVFREKYGKKQLKYSLFKEFPDLREFKTFILRNNGSNFNSDYIRDRLASSISEGLGVDYQRGRPVIVYYNGAYYGIHNIRERSNEHYFETHYGYDPDNIDLLKADNTVSNGSSADYVELMNWLEQNHLDDEENYNYVASKIDIDNFINYVHTELFANNRDWPSNNLKKWRVANPAGLWRWFLYDMDFGFGTNMSKFTNNIFEFATAEDGETWPNGPESTLLLRRLLENSGFKRAFVNRMAVLLSMNFESSRVESLIERMMAEIEAEIPRDQERWHHDVTYMNQQLSKIKKFAKSRQGVILDEMMEFFSLGKIVRVQFEVEGSGQILVHGLPLDQYPMEIQFFEGHEVEVTALASQGGVFIGWSDGVTEKSRVVDPAEIASIKAIFK